ncbi:MAG: TRAP transporter substrate-binding protein DctP [Prevotellaceae bacterium]|nr:TRAP transporter substrate-binding protein DctP [Prevotellaceae bacterium]
MKKIIALLLSLVLVLSFTACGSNGGGSSDGPVTIKVAVQQNEDHETCKAVQRIKEKVESETDGNVILDIYPDSALGDYTAVFDEVRMGTIDMAVQSFSGEYDPAFEIGYLPYLFTNYDEASKVLSEGSNTYKMIEKKCDENNMVFMGYFVEGFVQVASKNYIDNMGDPNAKKKDLMRCPAIESGRLAMECQGFPTVTIPYADLYTSLQTGVCDGWMGGTAELNYVSFRDVIKYLYVVNQQMENNAAMINKDVFNSLSPEYQKILKDAVLEEAAASFDRAQKTDETNFQLLKDYGIEVVELSQDEIDALAEQVRTKTWDADFKSYGDDAKAAVYADMGWELK